MKQLIYISPLDIEGINAVSDLGNDPSFLKHLEYLDYHYVFLSTLYQSGINYFETDLKKLPNNLLNNPFWKDRFQNLSPKQYLNSTEKAIKILDNNFDRKLDNEYRAPQFKYLLNHFTSLFYSLNTNSPFVSTQFTTAKDFNFLESRLSKELYKSITNFYNLINSESIQTIVPQYSVLKKDLKRFEEIAESSLFRKYSESLRLLPTETISKSLKNDIKDQAIKIYRKHASSIDLKNMTFSFIKSNKKILDLFTNKITSILGDFLINNIEKMVSEKRKIHYYDFKDAFLLRLFAERLRELQKVGGQEAFKNLLTELKNSH